MSVFDRMMKTAQSMLGTRYVWGGNDPKGGVDCSGFTKLVYASIGIELPRVSNLQARAGTVVSRDQAQPGDLVWWDLNGRNDGADHVGIYLGNGKAMEASSSKGQVVVRNLWGNAHFTHVNGAPAGAAASAAMQAQGAGAATPAAVVAPEPRPQTGLPAMGSLARGGALGIGDLRRDEDDDDDPFDIAALYDAVDDDDPGENEETVGPYAVARMMMDHYGAEPRRQPPAPTPMAPRPAPTPMPSTSGGKFAR